MLDQRGGNGQAQRLFMAATGGSAEDAGRHDGDGESHAGQSCSIIGQANCLKTATTLPWISS
jgi:hypothetical protein